MLDQSQDRRASPKLPGASGLENVNKSPVEPEKSEVGLEVLDRIRFSVMFRALPPGDFARLMAAAYVQTSPRDAVLFRQGDPADRFLIVLDGQVGLIVQAQGRRESTIDIVGPGETVALASIFDEGSFPVTARVVEAAKVVVVPAAPFRAHLAGNFQLITSMMASLSAHLRFLVGQIGELKLKTTGQRLGSFILGLTEAQEGGATVRLPYDKKLLANRLGMKPESLSRALGRLREVGVVGDNDTLIIDDVARLRRFCHEADAGSAG